MKFKKSIFEKISKSFYSHYKTEKFTINFTFNFNDLSKIPEFAKISAENILAVEDCSDLLYFNDKINADFQVGQHFFFDLDKSEKESNFYVALNKLN